MVDFHKSEHKCRFEVVGRGQNFLLSATLLRKSFQVAFVDDFVCFSKNDVFDYVCLTTSSAFK